MSALLESLRTRSPIPAWAPLPATARHFPLPIGPYPTADTAAAMRLQHLAHQPMHRAVGDAS